MSKKPESSSARGKLLDAWTPPAQAGEPIGCLATTFTFDAAFFEEECLSRFLQMQTDAAEDGAAYLIEREEKLAQVLCAAALVDQHHARGTRSLRWDLLAARLPHGILHAKVSLLLWSHHARLIVASANLTNDGYRRNQEIFGVLDYFVGSPAPLPCLWEIIEFLREAATYSALDAVVLGPALMRWNALLNRVREQCDGWGDSSAPRGAAKIRIMPVLVGPQRPSALETLRTLWPDGASPCEARVVSPFFDPPHAPNHPTRELWKTLRQRGAASVTYDVTAEEVSGERVLLLHAPQSLQSAQPAREQATTSFRKLQLDNTRPLHAKTLWLENDRWVLYMLGSSNFTSPGMGVGQTRNLEANLAYCVSHSQNATLRRELEAACLPAETIRSDSDLRWQPIPEEGEDAPTVGVLPLPPFFGEAIFDIENGIATLTFAFHGTAPTGWVLLSEDSELPVADERRWYDEGAPSSWKVSWLQERPPSGFSVHWEGAQGVAWWPVNAQSGAALPPPDELRDLPLEILIALLTSARPSHEVLHKYSRQKQEADGIDQLDPHKRVDTSTFLLQRTRRVSWALAGLRERLERPITSQQALEWRVNGPLGARALSEAIKKEARSHAERGFLLAELALELAQVKPIIRSDCLPPNEVSTALRNLIKDLQGEISPVMFEQTPALQNYVETAFKEAL